MNQPSSEGASLRGFLGLVSAGSDEVPKSKKTASKRSKRASARKRVARDVLRPTARQIEESIATGKTQPLAAFRKSIGW